MGWLYREGVLGLGLLWSSTGMAQLPYGEFYHSLKATHAKNWSLAELKKPLKARIKPLEGMALEFNQKFNERDGFKMTPIPRRLGARQNKELVSALQALPKPIADFLDQHVIAIYTAVNIGGTAMAGSVYSEKDLAQAKFGFIILDLSQIDRSLNEWLTYKESTVFAPLKNHHLSVQLAPPKENTKIATMRYLLVHELGHIFHAVKGLQPSYITVTWQDQQWQQFPFNRPELARKQKLGFDYYPLYDEIKFYRRQAPFDLDDAPEVYEWLEGSTYPSLYAAVNPYEDFAETFALFAHVHLLNWDHRIELEKKGKAGFKRSWHNLINKKSMEPKVKIIKDSLYGQKVH